MLTISIDGSIGAGKTTVLRRLGEDLGLPVFLEPVDEWTACLERFYMDRDRWGLCLNTKVLCSFARAPRSGTILLCERSPVTCMRVFAEAGTKDPVERDVLGSLYDAVGWVPDVVVYIRTSPRSCLERIKKRARAAETTITIEYLEEIHKRYEDLYAVCTNVVDGEMNEDAVYEAVRAAVAGYSTQALSSK